MWSRQLHRMSMQTECERGLSLHGRPGRSITQRFGAGYQRKNHGVASEKLPEEPRGGVACGAGQMEPALRLLGAALGRAMGLASYSPNARSFWMTGPLISKETIMTARVHSLPALLLLACLAPVAAAFDEPGAAREATIRSLEEEERQAVLKEDVPALERLWSEQLIVNTPQNEVSADRSVVLDRVKRGLIRYSRFDRQIEVIRFNEDLAIVMGSEIVVRKADAGVEPKAVHRRFTNVWRQSARGWRMIVRHATIIPGS
jgi:ketosteroid isomerase-like protein